MIGLVFSSYSLAMFIFSPCYKQLLDKHGSIKLLTLGLLCEGISIIAFGLLYYVQNWIVFLSLSMLCRFIQGFSNGCLNAACKCKIIVIFV